MWNGAVGWHGVPTDPVTSTAREWLHSRPCAGLNSGKAHCQSMDRNDPEACLAEQSVIVTLGALTGAVSHKHVQVRSGPGTIAGGRSQRQPGQALHHEKPGSAGHRCAAAGEDRGTSLVRPVMEHALQYVRVRARRHMIEEVAGNEGSAICNARRRRSPGGPPQRRAPGQTPCRATSDAAAAARS